MAGRRKQPEERPRPKGRPKRPGGRARARTHPATLAAWLVLLAGIAALIWMVRGERQRERERASLEPTPPAAARPAARPAPSTVPAGSPGPPAQSPEPIEAEREERVVTAVSATPRETPAPAGPVDLLAHPRASRVRPRIAIIIDDVGQDLQAIESATRIPYRLTFSVIPHLSHSRESANLVNARGYEVMMHLPMEPIDYPREDPGTGAIKSGMEKEDVRRVVMTDLAAVPHVRGVNNHMGSRVTSDPRQMRAVLATLATTPYYFVDSRTTASSVAYEIAREMKVPSAERSIFLDDQTDKGSVEAQFRKLIAFAREHGHAIAIGHPHAITLEVLRRELPRLEKAGIDVVFASALVS